MCYKSITDIRNFYLSTLTILNLVPSRSFQVVLPTLCQKWNSVYKICSEILFVCFYVLTTNFLFSLFIVSCLHDQALILFNPIIFSPKFKGNTCSYYFVLNEYSLPVWVQIQKLSQLFNITLTDKHIYYPPNWTVPNVIHAYKSFSMSNLQVIQLLVSIDVFTTMQASRRFWHAQIGTPQVYNFG